MNLEIRKSAAMAAVVLSTVLSSTYSYSVAYGSYLMSNHPDGSASPPAYGLRLDGLLTGNTNEIYTFDFDHISSSMYLTYDGSSVVISGSAFGGEDAGSGGYISGTTAVWDIYFEYDVGVSQPGTDGGLSDVEVNADYQNFGTVSSVLGDFELSDKAANGGGPSFYLGDENGGGHRGHDGISGWGWLRHGDDCLTASDCNNIPYSDWLFVATPNPVPVPAAAWLFASALLGLVGIKRNKH